MYIVAHATSLTLTTFNRKRKQSLRFLLLFPPLALGKEILKCRLNLRVGHFSEPGWVGFWTLKFWLLGENLTIRLISGFNRFETSTCLRRNPERSWISRARWRGRLQRLANADSGGGIRRCLRGKRQKIWQVLGESDNRRIWQENLTGLGEDFLLS